jgi:hypothetical protein
VAELPSREARLDETVPDLLDIDVREIDWLKAERQRHDLNLHAGDVTPSRQLVTILTPVKALVLVLIALSALVVAYFVASIVAHQLVEIAEPLGWWALLLLVWPAVLFVAKALRRGPSTRPRPPRSTRRGLRRPLAADGCDPARRG